jgi:hypothetical protein
MSERAIRTALEELRAALRQRRLNREQAHHGLQLEAIDGGRGQAPLPSDVSHGGTTATREEGQK